MNKKLPRIDLQIVQSTGDQFLVSPDYPDMRWPVPKARREGQQISLLMAAMRNFRRILDERALEIANHEQSVP